MFETLWFWFERIIDAVVQYKLLVMRRESGVYKWDFIALGIVIVLCLIALSLYT